MVVEGDTDSNASMVGNLKACDLVGREQKRLCFDDTRKVVRG